MIESEYAKICESEAEYDKGITEIILDSYSKEIEQISLEALEKFFDKKKNTLKNQINSKYKSYLLFRQPIILLIFFLASNQGYNTKKNWPFTLDVLRPVYISLGKKFDY